ncbi:MAG: RluA family pseudouridine synthase [Pseudomonadota bacterium]
MVVNKPEEGERLDIFISSRLPDCSRTKAGQLILKAVVCVDGKVKKPGYRIKDGERICGKILPSESLSVEPEPIDLHILYEDDGFIVLNKQPGIVVHPAPGHRSGTLVNALLYRWPEIKGVGDALRPGIVHRLDKDTSGLLLVAKTEAAHQNLIGQFKSKKVVKTYLALVYGSVLQDEGVISLPIGRDPKDRKRMSTVSRKGRFAETGWRVKERFKTATLLEVHLKTGRTHQIRVHCAAMGHPVVGDPVYGRRKAKNKLPAKRQILHAWRLRLSHPVTGCGVSFEAPVPQDILQWNHIFR